ncbi:MAG TPA: hypothetical protein VNC60_09000 [Actinomycetota bacterium]|nr:hypothetical protein [Actinomycetota bacterium]
MRRALVFIAAATVALAMGVPASADHGGAAAQKLYPPDAEPFGWSHAEWLGAYITWLVEIPTARNPLVHPDSPLNCAEQRGGKVVFLGTQGADCTVPDDAALAFTPAAWECSTAEALGDTWSELRSCARDNFDHDFGPELYHQSVYIDGRRLRHQRDWVVRSPGEIIDLPADNIFGADSGATKSVTKGFLFILRPLAEGRHRIVVDAVDEVYGEFHWVWKLNVVDDD